MRFTMRLGVIVISLALAATRLGAHPEDAVERAMLDALIAEEPDNAEFFLRRARYREDHREWAAAEEDLQCAAKLLPGSARVTLALGRVYLASDRLPVARVQLDAVLQREPRNAEALVLRARLFVRVGDPARAQADFSAAIRELAQPSPGLFLERAALALDPALILEGLDEGLARLGPVTPLLERALALELAQGRTDAALARLDALAAQAERKEQMLKRRGDILAAAGRTAEARRAYSAALATIEQLPAWLRADPGTTKLAAELLRLTHFSS